MRDRQLSRRRWPVCLPLILTLCVCVSYAVPARADGGTVPFASGNVISRVLFEDARQNPDTTCMPWAVPPERQCQYIREHRSTCDGASGIIDYLSLHYCWLQGWYVLFDPDAAQSRRCGRSQARSPLACLALPGRSGDELDRFLLDWCNGKQLLPSLARTKIECAGHCSATCSCSPGSLSSLRCSPSWRTASSAPRSRSSQITSGSLPTLPVPHSSPSATAPPTSSRSSPPSPRCTPALRRSSAAAHHACAHTPFAP